MPAGKKKSAPFPFSEVPFLFLLFIILFVKIFFVAVLFDKVKYTVRCEGSKSQFESKVSSPNLGTSCIISKFRTSGKLNCKKLNTSAQVPCDPPYYRKLTAYSLSHPQSTLEASTDSIWRAAAGYSKFLSIAIYCN